jgi:hypothetical protein
MKVQKGITANTFKRRASLPPEEREYTTSYHHVGSRSGMHPEDRPYSTTTRSRYHAPTTNNAYFEVDEEEEFHSRPTTRVGTSARRYDLAPYNNGRAERRTEGLQRAGKHPIFYIGIFLMILVVFLTAYTLIPPALQKWSDDRTYGFPRTFQTDANVGHGGVEHFIALNNHGTIEVLEIPTNPSPMSQPRLYIIVRLSNQGADLVPATVSFPDVNGDGKPDLQVTVLNSANPSVWILFNNGTTFVPKL